VLTSTSMSPRRMPRKLLPPSPQAQEDSEIHEAVAVGGATVDWSVAATMSPVKSSVVTEISRSTRRSGRLSMTPRKSYKESLRGTSVVKESPLKKIPNPDKVKRIFGMGLQGELTENADEELELRDSTENPNISSNSNLEMSSSTSILGMMRTAIVAITLLVVLCWVLPSGSGNFSSFSFGLQSSVLQHVPDFFLDLGRGDVSHDNVAEMHEIGDCSAKESETVLDVSQALSKEEVLNLIESTLKDHITQIENQLENQAIKVSKEMDRLKKYVHEVHSRTAESLEKKNVENLEQKRAGDVHGSLANVQSKIEAIERNFTIYINQTSKNEALEKEVEVINDKIESFSEVIRNVKTLERLNRQDRLGVEDIKGNIKALEFLFKTTTQDVDLLKKTASRTAELDRMNLSATDWASSVKGASIVSSPPTHPLSHRSLTLLGIPIWQKIPKPDLLLDPESTGGMCWAFTGQQGSVVIRLGQPVLLSGLRAVSGVGKCPHSALPSKLTVWDEERGGLLATLHYRKDGSLQSQSRIMPSELPVQLFKFEFERFHYHSDYTCVGKVEIFGNLVMYE